MSLFIDTLNLRSKLAFAFGLIILNELRAKKKLQEGSSLIIKIKSTKYLKTFLNFIFFVCSPCLPLNAIAHTQTCLSVNPVHLNRFHVFFFCCCFSDALALISAKTSLVELEKGSDQTNFMYFLPFEHTSMILASISYLLVENVH